MILNIEPVTPSHQPGNVSALIILSVQVGNKADLERSRVLQTSDGCDLAIEFGAKFTETSPGMGHHIDELLVGIVMQMR